jgi:hypothetical protein
MKLLDPFSGKVVEATVTVNHAASSYGIPVLVVAGEALGTVEAAAFEILEASDGERLALARGGYRLAAATNDDAEYVEREAQRAARRVLAGSDPTCGDWREAGYATPRKAAEALVGRGSGAEWERTVEIVAEALAAEGGAR